MPKVADSKREKLVKKVESYAEDHLESSEKLEIIRNKDQIVSDLMAGKFRDLGGLTAMRGFVYQYYVSMFYIISMIYPKRDSWWDSVVLEYFDDVTLIGDSKIRFIQVKTVKEGGSKAHAPHEFTTRKSLKKPESPRDNFNSWVEKNVLNYDYFLENDSIVNIDKSSYVPQFEIITNTKSKSLSDLMIYTGNVNFEIEHDISPQDKIKAAILEPVKGLKFEGYSKKKIDYYLKKLYINKFGSTRELYENIIDMIEETIVISDIRAKSIAEYVFQKLFAFVISNSHEDNEERLKKSDLVLTKSQINHSMKTWVIEAKELISESSYYDSAVAIFKKVLEELELEFKTQFVNENFKSELLEKLQSVNEHITESNRINSTYCVSILNKIFNGNNSLSMWDFERGDIKINLKESMRYIIYFLVFYENHSETYKTAKLLFHEGHSSVIDNILFTIYHARNNSNKLTTIEKVKLLLTECQVSRQITLDLYCLLIGTKSDSTSSEVLEILNKLKITDINSNPNKITDVPNNMRFVDVSKIEDLFNGLKEEASLESFKSDNLLPLWKEYLDNIVKKVREDYIEN